MNLVTTPPPGHDIIMVAVPEEKLKQPLSNYTHINDNKIITWYEALRGEEISTMLLLSTGKHIESAKAWNAYKKSHKIYFIVCQKNNSSTE